jgi:dienelactone hydrolase
VRSIHTLVSRVAGFPYAMALLAIPAALCSQNPSATARDSANLREYAGAYRWDGDSGFVYFQPWAEFTGSRQLVAIDERGEARALFPTGRDVFTAGTAVGRATPMESRLEFQRDAAGRVASVVWRRSGAARTARRSDVERIEDVQFRNGDVRLAGSLYLPSSGEKVPAVILVHGSGPLDRDYMLPHARFLVRRGMAVLGYDKRGVGESTGDWRTASFPDLAGDVIAAYEYLKSRPDIDPERIGLLGFSQAGWIMPIAATMAPGIAFVVSVSGAGVSVAETTIDQARNEMTAGGMKPDVVAEVVRLMELQYHFARTGGGWDEYAAAREKLASRFGRAPPSFPGTRDDPHWDYIRLVYFHDPGPTLRQLRVPTLAIFGGLDNNIVAEKNRAAWEAALRTAGNQDHTLRVLPRANHIMLEANVGSNAEMPSLQRFVPEYAATVTGWLASRLPGIQRP